MTEEEIRPIAEDYVEEYCHCSDGEYTDGSLVCAGIGTALIVSRQLEKQIVELEKENAELKVLLDCKNCSELLEEECEVCAEASHFKCKGKAQLTKAKEIICEYVRLANLEKEDTIAIWQLYHKAEAFLNEVKR